MQGRSPSPRLLPTWSPKSELVRALENSMMKQKLQIEEDSLGQTEKQPPGAKGTRCLTAGTGPTSHA